MSIETASRWLDARVPSASAEAVAVFRVVFGLALLAYFAMKPVSAEWIPLAVPESAFHRLALTAFEAAPWLADGLLPWIVFWTVLFIVGALARTAFALVTVGALAWGLLYTSRIGAHSVQVLLTAMLCAVWSRWGDAWSVDAWWRRRRVARHQDVAPNIHGRRYGYSMWMPGFVLGTSLAAAALAKLRVGGLGWITNGTVKYHFLTDSPQAPVDWGLRIAHYDNLAILMSFGAVAIEACVIVGVCSIRYRYRVAAGAATLALLIGFKLFQGLFWPAWAIMLLSFLPWHLIRPVGLRQPPDPARGVTQTRPYLRWAQTAAVLAVVGQQVVASALRLEIAPFVSAYDMYSSTYSSPADYESKAGLTYWIVADFADGTREPCKVSRQDANAVAQGDAVRPESVEHVLDRCFRSGRAIRAVSVEGRRPAIDWARWQLGEEMRVPFGGPVPIKPAR